jgi:hypothetical protein
MPQTHATVDEIAAAFISIMGKYVEFDYEPLEECRTPMTPSKAADRADTVYVGPIQQAKGFLNHGCVVLTKESNWIVKLQSMNRRVRTGPNQGRYKWRSYRVEGVALETVLFNAGPSRGQRPTKVRLFENADAREAALEFAQ